MEKKGANVTIQNRMTRDFCDLIHPLQYSMR